MLTSENRRRILLVHNNLPSIFVIERANGLAILYDCKRLGEFSAQIGLADHFDPGFCWRHSPLPEAASRVTVMGQFSQSAVISWETQ